MIKNITPSGRYMQVSGGSGSTYVNAYGGAQGMNQRLKELAVQAGFQYNRYEGIGWAGASLPKFAELIVAECLGIVDDAERGGSNDIWDNAVKFIRRDLQEHFGVTK
jgi:hypothetical protein